jgi:hypothetical protein
MIVISVCEDADRGESQSTNKKQAQVHTLFPFNLRTCACYVILVRTPCSTMTGKKLKRLPWVERIVFVNGLGN